MSLGGRFGKGLPQPCPEGEPGSRNVGQGSTLWELGGHGGESPGRAGPAVSARQLFLWSCEVSKGSPSHRAPGGGSTLGSALCQQIRSLPSP